ncbi:sigma factor-like helix-turn-helix DNA-binding protein, partial [Psychrobacter celer]
NLEVSQDKNIEGIFEHVKDEDSTISTINRNKAPSMSTRLDDLHLSDRYLKLIKRLRNVSLSNENFSLGETLGELLSLPTSRISNLPGVGSSYVKIFEDLKLLTQVSLENEKLEYTNSISSDSLQSCDTSNMRISLLGIDSKFTKPLEKYARYINVNDLSEHINEILNFDRHTLITLPHFGTSVVDKLIEFRGLIQDELQAIILGDINYKEFESALIVPRKLDQLSLTQIERILLEDIDTYFDKLTFEEAEIIQKRWGFVEDKQTLEEISEKFGLTRERIRQKETKINNNFIRNMRLGQLMLWQFLEPKLNPDISINFKDLFLCFYSEKEFYEFLSLVCGQEKLIEYVYPEIDKAILNVYFVENGAPALINDIREYLDDLKLVEIRNIDNAIVALQNQDSIMIEGQYVWPKQLGKAEATACVLVNHEKGLPWLDVAKIVNSNSYSKTSIQEARLEQTAFELPDYIFLSGKGIYKHTNFIDTDNIVLDDIFLNIMEYGEAVSRDVFHLSECYRSSNSLQKYDYYEIRHFVKHFGEDYGFYFDGRSQTDSVGLKKDFKSITQRDVIIDTMRRNEKPLTKPEIANLLKSKSLNHAGFYLDEMINSGTVVQVDRMLYTLPELAYANIDLNKYIGGINKLLQKYNKPVEPSIFRNELNYMFSSSYSKYFYASIARLYSKKEGWFRKYNLYSLKEIPFQSLYAVLESVCNPSISINENIDVIQRHIAIDRSSADRALRNWHHQIS